MYDKPAEKHNRLMLGLPYVGYIVWLLGLVSCQVAAGWRTGFLAGTYPQGWPQGLKSIITDLAQLVLSAPPIIEIQSRLSLCIHIFIC